MMSGQRHWPLANLRSLDQFRQVEQAKSKLTREASKKEIDLRRLACLANHFDRLAAELEKERRRLYSSAVTRYRAAARGQAEPAQSPPGVTGAATVSTPGPVLLGNVSASTAAVPVLTAGCRSRRGSKDKDKQLTKLTVSPVVEVDSYDSDEDDGTDSHSGSYCGYVTDLDGRERVQSLDLGSDSDSDSDDDEFGMDQHEEKYLFGQEPNLNASYNYYDCQSGTRFISIEVTDKEDYE